MHAYDVLFYHDVKRPKSSIESMNIYRDIFQNITADSTWLNNLLFDVQKKKIQFKPTVLR